MKKAIIWVIFLMLALIGCASPKQKLSGTWKGTLNGSPVEYVFIGDTLIVNNELSVTYFVTKNTLRFGIDEEPGQYSIKGKTLTITQPNFRLVLTKQK
jgi:hypothetical protein